MQRLTTSKPAPNKMTENESMGRAYGRGVGFFVGEPCDKTCNEILFHVYCNTTTRQCECQPQYPVNIRNSICAKASRLGDGCEYNESCMYVDENSFCHEDKKCRCNVGYLIKPGEISDPICIQGKSTGFLDNSDMTTMISVIAGLMIFTALFCFLLRLFSRARFDRPRDRIGNASAPSVVLTGLEGAANSTGSSRRASRSSGSSRRPSSSSMGSLKGCRPGPSTSTVSTIRAYPGLPAISGATGTGAVCSFHGKQPIRRTASSPASADSHQHTLAPGAYRGPYGGPQTLSPSSLDTALRTGSPLGGSLDEAEIT